MDKQRKWQRITYMPATTIGPNGRRITGSKEHIALSRRAAREGMVMLKNDHHTLPLRDGAKLAVFGKGQADYVKGGGGSGDTTVAYVHSLLDGLREKQAEGRLSLFEPLSDYYHADVKQQYESGCKPGKTVEPVLPDALLEQAKNFTDTALISISRFSEEGKDRTGSPFDGDFYLSREETAMVDTVQTNFSNVIVVLNTGGMMDTGWFHQNDRIQAALLTWQGGIEGGNATADILCGDESPSGRLSDTFAIDFDAYPSSRGFNDSEDYVEYQDDIYIGYRYFETIPGAAQKVCYPFGFGLSYTTFVISGDECVATEDAFSVRATVTNTGQCAGKQVVQIYCQAPQGKLGKPRRVLVGFEKTKKLAPQESQQITIRFCADDFASYDDLGKVQASAWILEAGEYRFFIGENVRDVQPLPLVWTLEEDRVLTQLTPKCVPSQLPQRMLADGSMEALPEQTIPMRYPKDAAALPGDGKRPAESKFVEPSSAWGEPSLPQLIDVYQGEMTLESFMDQLNDEQMVQLLGGQPNRGVANTFGFGNLMMYGIPNVMTADGPAGLRIRPRCGVNTTAFPCANMLCCTWNPGLLYEIGQAGAREVKENGIGIWLTPAINIHRSPLCGRNFEYYSEDPLLTGQMASAMIQGIQSEGIACSFKHFACNNKETNRRNSDSRVSERALREIYLKGFEICVKTASPWTIMSAYNLINGVRSSENQELLTGILRDEWGFDGVVTTDWYTFGEQYREIAAGNDIKMGCGMPEHTLQKLSEGELSIEDVRRSVERLLKLIIKLD